MRWGRTNTAWVVGSREYQGARECRGARGVSALQSARCDSSQNTQRIVVQTVPTSTRTSRLGLYSCLIRHSARIRPCFILSRPSRRPSSDLTPFHSLFGLSSAVARRARLDKLHLFSVTLYTYTLFVNKGKLFLSSCLYCLHI
jgi:hypothetical protein